MKRLNRFKHEYSYYCLEFVQEIPGDGLEIQKTYQLHKQQKCTSNKETDTHKAIGQQKE